MDIALECSNRRKNPIITRHIAAVSLLLRCKDFDAEQLMWFNRQPDNEFREVDE